MTYPPNPPPPSGEPPYGGEIPPESPGYGYTEGPRPGGGPKNGMGTSSLVLGIVGAASGAIIPCLGWVLGILAVVFGSLGVSRANKGEATNKTVATAGLVLGIVAIVVGTLAVFLWSDVDMEQFNQ